MTFSPGIQVRKIAVRAAAALILMGPTAIAQSAVVDQNALLPQPGMPIGSLGGFQLTPGIRTGQSFEVGITGYLDRMDVQFSFIGMDMPSEGAEFALYTLSEDGLPTAEAIATAWLAPPDDLDPLFFGHYTLSLDFSDQDLFFHEGESYALVTETSSLSMAWGIWIDSVDDGTQYFTGNRYDAGAGLYDGLGTPWQNFDIDDPAIAFDATIATYMRPVPIPGAGLLLTSSLLALLTNKRERTTQSDTT